MQLAEGLWIAGSYYVDRSVHGELRVVGPHNHLHYGAVGFSPELFIVEDVRDVGGALQITGRFKLENDFLPDAAMGHIRRVRQFIEPEAPDKQGLASPTFADVYKTKPRALAPMVTRVTASPDSLIVSYKRQYGLHWYGASLSLPEDVLLRRNDAKYGFEIIDDNGDWMEFTLIADTDNRIPSPLAKVLMPFQAKPARLKALQPILDRTSVEITHLVNNNKTGGFGYGTVFPRDWMESADLGEYDIAPAARRYMYHKALEHVAPGGEGWHEDAVGEFAASIQDELKAVASEIRELETINESIGTFLRQPAQKLRERQVARSMIDIEPRYVLGLQRLQWRQLSLEDQERLRQAAAYVLDQAERHAMLTFKPLPIWERRYLGGELGDAGNWRDSHLAFRKVGPVVAPYDVNVVLYPEALKLIVAYADKLGADKERAKKLWKKWQQTSKWFEFINPDGLSSMALALYGVDGDAGKTHFHQLQVNHLDEAYALFYGTPAEQQLVSFVRRLVDPKYFYTASGPILVGARERSYDTTQYHGKVTWTKQTAYVMGGLQRQLTRRDLGSSTREALQKALIKTAEASLRAFEQLGGVPELHYDKRGKAARYNEQPTTEGPSNAVQLWSAVGARRIIRAYNEAITNAA